MHRAREIYYNSCRRVCKSWSHRKRPINISTLHFHALKGWVLNSPYPVIRHRPYTFLVHNLPYTACACSKPCLPYTACTCYTPCLPYTVCTCSKPCPALPWQDSWSAPCIPLNSFRDMPLPDLWPRGATGWSWDHQHLGKSPGRCWQRCCWCGTCERWRRYAEERPQP